jgi:hypothetical protein
MGAIADRGADHSAISLKSLWLLMPVTLRIASGVGGWELLGFSRRPAGAPACVA